MITSGTDYHRHTSYDRHNLGGHFLNWADQPNIYKEYPGSDMGRLSREVPAINKKLSEMIGKETLKDYPEHLVSDHVRQIFTLAYTLTSKSRYPGGEFFHRSVPSAGGLYPCELYMAVQSVTGMEDGLYHYAVRHHALERLRKGSFLKTGGVLTFFITAVFYRSAWKYRDRSYRYHLLDSGHLVENLCLTLKGLNLPFELDYDFEDETVNPLLGLDTQREVCLAVVRVPGKETSSQGRPEQVKDLPAVFQKASRVAYKEIRYPAVEEIHKNSAYVLTSRDPLPNILFNIGPVPHLWQKIAEPDHWPEKMNYTQAILKRRSLRNFVTTQLPKAHFEALLTMLWKTDPLPGFYEDSVCMGFLAGNVEGIEPGCYWVNRSEQCVSLVKPGEMMGRMAHICLDQEWLGQAALLFFFVTNLKLLEQNRGSRGYRHAMLTAGRFGQKLYLGATAMELGCCGIGAFYDHEASAFLDLSEDSQMLYLVAVGIVKKIF